MASAPPPPPNVPRVAPCGSCGRFAVVFPAPAPSARGGDQSSAIVASPARIIAAMRAAREAAGLRDGSDAAGVRQPVIDETTLSVSCGFPDCPGIREAAATESLPLDPPTSGGRRSAAAAATAGAAALATLAQRFLARSPACADCGRCLPVPYHCGGVLGGSSWLRAPSAAMALPDVAPAAAAPRNSGRRRSPQPATSPSSSAAAAATIASVPVTAGVVEFRCRYLPAVFPFRIDIVESCAAATAAGGATAVAHVPVGSAGQLRGLHPLSVAEVKKAADGLHTRRPDSNRAPWYETTLFAVNAPTVFSQPHPVLKAAGATSAAAGSRTSAAKAKSSRVVIKQPATSSVKLEDNKEAAGSTTKPKAIPPAAAGAVVAADEPVRRAASPGAPQAQEDPGQQQQQPRRKSARAESNVSAASSGAHHHRAAADEDHARPQGPPAASNADDDAASSSSSEEEEIVHWARCNLCDEWRIVPEAVDPEATFVCSDLVVDGRPAVCKTKGIKKKFNAQRKEHQLQRAARLKAARKSGKNAEDVKAEPAADKWPETHRPEDGLRCGFSGAEMLFPSSLWAEASRMLTSTGNAS